MLFEKCDGPPCPRCGCQDADIIADPRAAGGAAPIVGGKPGAWPTSWFASGRARCKHCGTRFSFHEQPSEHAAADVPEEEPAEEPDLVDTPAAARKPTECPVCRESGYHVYKTKTAADGVTKTRYRKCKGCGHTGDDNKSVGL